jgi:hypothetical protein
MGGYRLLTAGAVTSINEHSEEGTRLFGDGSSVS